MKKICIITPMFMPVPAVLGGGIENLITALLNQNELNDKFKFTVYTTPHPNIKNNYKNSNIKQIELNFFVKIIKKIINKIFNILKIEKYYDFNSILYKKIAKRIKKEQYDYLLVENNMQLYKTIYKHNKDKKIIFHLHNDLNLIDKTEEDYKFINNTAYKILVISNYLKERLNKVEKTEKIEVFSNAIDANKYLNHKANQEKIVLLELTKRANNSKLPEVEIVDLKMELANGNRSMLSVSLHDAIEKNLKEKRQTILFLNRRGYSTFIMCRECGYTVKCKNCDISLTYHKTENKLKCHYCGYEENVVTICPECQSTKIRYFGTGTQRLEQEINKIFPKASTIRMDIDTVTKKNSHEEILNKFRDDGIDILIGTQMVVKGHHFPNVTLVGVIAADSSLNIDDYRANERTFQLLTQVAGRAGRENLDGKVIIQTYNPENFSIQCAKEQNYQKFSETEIALRKQLKYPPFCDIILIGFNSLVEKEIIEVSNKVYNYLKNNLDEQEFIVLKPMPSPIDKIQNRFRWRIIIKGNMTEETNTVINNCLKNIYDSNYKNTRVTVDVNPNNMI